MTDIPGLPFPQAIGWITGYVKGCDNDTRQGTFVLPDGQELPCTVNYKFPDELKKPEPRQCTIYPTALADGTLVLKICGPTKTKHDEEQFRITGQISRIRGDLISINVWSERKRRNFRVAVRGYLQAKQGEYWRLFAVIEDGKLILIDGEKLADNFNPNQLFPPTSVTLFAHYPASVSVS